MILFHVTSRRNAEAILAEGLRTDVMGWNTQYVWGFDDLTIAERLAREGAWGGKRGDNAIFEVDATGLEVVPDPHPGWGDERSDHAFAVPHSIEPERVRLIAA